MLEYKYDTQLLIEGEALDEDRIIEYFSKNFQGDSLPAVGDDELIKIHNQDIQIPAAPLPEVLFHSDNSLQFSLPAKSVVPMKMTSIP